MAIEAPHRAAVVAAVVGIVGGLVGCAGGGEPTMAAGAGAGAAGLGGERDRPGSVSPLAETFPAPPAPGPAAGSAATPPQLPDAKRDAGPGGTGSEGNTGFIPSSPNTSGACPDALLCDDFETQPATLSGDWSTVSPGCSGDGVVTVDQQLAHSGTRSLRVQSGGGYCNHVFATPSLDLREASDDLWVRFYVRFEQELDAAHVTFLALHDEISDSDLRMGGQNGILMWNRESDDATLPELSPSGVNSSVAPPAATWQCIEFHLQGASGQLQTYVDGAAVPGLVVDDSGTPDIDGQWLAPGAWGARVRDLKLGWESYGDRAMSLWFDDVVVATVRVGC